MTLSAQNIIPIPVDTTSVWRISREHNDESCVYHHNSIYYIDGKTIINAKEYYKVYEEGYYSESPVNPQYPSCNDSYDYTGVYRGAIRTENGKVYGYTVTGEAGGLLMDFTLNVGDTLYSSICQDGKVIESIDSVLVGNEYRRRFNFANSWHCNWMIEGVGHECGLFESMDDPFENNSSLICYGENGIPIFGNENCDITVGNVEKLMKENYVEIYPNPAYHKISIDASELNYGIKSYLLTDIYGRIVLKNDFKSMNENKLVINLNTDFRRYVFST